MASASELKKGSYFIYDNEPVRVIRKELVAYGTHSHSKLKLFIQGLHEKGERSVTKDGAPLSFGRCRVLFLPKGNNMQLVSAGDDSEPWTTSVVDSVAVG